MGGFLDNELLVPIFCSLPDPEPYLKRNRSYTAGPCNNDCPPLRIFSGTYSAGSKIVLRADDAIVGGNAATAILNPGSITQLRSGDYINLGEGVEIKDGALFTAQIKGCNEQN